MVKQLRYIFGGQFSSAVRQAVGLIFAAGFIVCAFITIIITLLTRVLQ